MLQYDRISVSAAIDINKTSVSKEYDIYHYWFLKMLVINFNHMFVMVVIIYQ